MHSSRMRTGRTLTVFRWRTPPRKFGGTPHPPENLEEPPPKIPPPKIWSASPRKFGADTPPAPPPVDRMTHASENITLAKTSFRPVNIQ